MSCYFRSSVLRLGDEAKDLIDGGVCIFFAEPVPDALAEVSVIHAPEEGPGDDLREGDLLVIGGSSLAITAVGDLASENLRSLGHVVVYVDPAPDTTLLPGAVHARGTVDGPRPGDHIELHRTA